MGDHMIQPLIDECHVRGSDFQHAQMFLYPHPDHDGYHDCSSRIDAYEHQFASILRVPGEVWQPSTWGSMTTYHDVHDEKGMNNHFPHCKPEHKWSRILSARVLIVGRSLRKVSCSRRKAAQRWQRIANQTKRKWSVVKGGKRGRVFWGEEEEEEEEQAVNEKKKTWRRTEVVMVLAELIMGRRRRRRRDRIKSMFSEYIIVRGNPLHMVVLYAVSGCRNFLDYQSTERWLYQL